MTLLASTDHALVALEGPLCPVLARRHLAERLRVLLTGAPLPARVAATTNPLVVLRHAAVYGPATAAAVERQLRALEQEALMSCRPVPGAPEALAALRAAGTPVTVVSSLSAAAVRSFLVVHGLLEPVKQIAARRSPDTATLAPDPFLVERAVASRGVPRSHCAFIGTRREDRRAARSAGVRVLTYRPTRGGWPALIGGEPRRSPSCAVLT